MALPWLTALKVIPWGEVIEAAPALLRGAKRYFQRTEEAAQATAPPPAAAAPEAAGLAPRLAQLEAQLAAWGAEATEQQRTSAKLIEALAEQNAQLVLAVDALRARVRLLSWVAGALCVAVAAVLAYVWAGR